MNDVGRERRVNELLGCSEDEILDILSEVNTQILIKAVSNEVARLKKLEADMINLFQK